MGGPENVAHGKVAIDGVYYEVGDDSRKVWRDLSDAWTDITPTAQNWATIVTDPFDPMRILAIFGGRRRH